MKKRRGNAMTLTSEAHGDKEQRGLRDVEELIDNMNGQVTMQESYLKKVNLDIEIISELIL
jgi:hypothetical protein